MSLDVRCEFAGGLQILFDKRHEIVGAKIRTVSRAQGQKRAGS